MELFLFARFHARPGQEAAHTVQFISAAEALIDHPLSVSLTEPMK